MEEIILNEANEVPSESQAPPESTSIETKTYSEEDMLQALQQEKEKWEADWKEQEHLKTLPQKEQTEAKQQQSMKRIADLEQQLLQKELRELATQALTKEKYPLQLAEILCYDNKEDMLSSLKHLTKTFDTCLADAVQEKLKGKTPQNFSSSLISESNLKDTLAKNIRGGFQA